MSRIFDKTRKSAVTAMVATAWIAGFALPAQAQDKPLPDAQVQANVLRQLASAPELSTQNIQTTSVYGTVTLSGNVHDDALRTKAENLAARAQGVKKVVDELTLGDTPAPSADAQAQGDGQTQAGQDGPGPGMVLQSDGTYAPAAPADGSQPQDANVGQPGDAGQPVASNQAPPPPPNGAMNGQDQYGPAGPPPPERRPMYGAPGGPGGPGRGDGQRAGIPVTVPDGTLVQVRINRGLDSNHIQPGTPFTGTIMNDVATNGVIAIPRGAQIEGNVVSAKKAGTFKGQGELSLQLTSLSLGGQTYPIQTVAWKHDGSDKSVRTIDSAIGGGALGALFGAAAGGGAGAAIGAGVGAALGTANSASSPQGRVIVPPETVLSFHLATPVPVTTVSQQEMGRLAYAAGPGQPPPPRRYYSPYGTYYR